jgi:hypothetical protein
MSRLLTFPCHSVPSDSNQLTGSIPSEVKELLSLTILLLCTWIGLSVSDERHAGSHFLAVLFHVPSDYNQLSGSIPSELRELTSLTTLALRTWIGFSCSYECHACSYFLAVVPSAYNQLAGSIPSELGELTLLTELWLCTWIGLSCSYECHACHACSHFLTIMFHQLIINSLVPFQANSEN